MLTKETTGSTDWADPDDAPALTHAMRERAEVFEGDRFIHRGRGRPKSASPKEQVNIRLDVKVLQRLRESGPGWQSRAAAILGDTIDEAETQAFDFPIDVAVTLPGGDIARGVGTITIRATDHATALAIFGTQPEAFRRMALLAVRWQA
jgi:uncharacterized protein (DUF4415 family)